jgi:hypothetical protein
VIPALKWLRQEDHEFEVTQSHKGDFGSKKGVYFPMLEKPAVESVSKGAAKGADTKIADMLK